MIGLFLHFVGGGFKHFFIDGGTIDFKLSVYFQQFLRTKFLGSLHKKFREQLNKTQSKMVYKTEGKDNELFSTPGKEEQQVFERKRAPYKDLTEKFVNTRNDYSKQFAHIYAARLAELRDVLIPRVQAKWGTFVY